MFKVRLSRGATIQPAPYEARRFDIAVELEFPESTTFKSALSGVRAFVEMAFDEELEQAKREGMG